MKRTSHRKSHIKPRLSPEAHLNAIVEDIELADLRAIRDEPAIVAATINTQAPEADAIDRLLLDSGFDEPITGTTELEPSFAQNTAVGSISTADDFEPDIGTPFAVEPLDDNQPFQVQPLPTNDGPDLGFTSPSPATETIETNPITSDEENFFADADFSALEEDAISTVDVELSLLLSVEPLIDKEPQITVTSPAIEFIDPEVISEPEIQAHVPAEESTKNIPLTSAKLARDVEIEAVSINTLEPVIDIIPTVAELGPAEPILNFIENPEPAVIVSPAPQEPIAPLSGQSPTTTHQCDYKKEQARLTIFAFTLSIVSTLVAIVLFFMLMEMRTELVKLNEMVDIMKDDIQMNREEPPVE